MSPGGHVRMCSSMAMKRITGLACKAAFVLLMVTWSPGHMGICLMAQDTGTLRLLIDPGSDFQFVVDRKFRLQQREITLSAGPHHFSFWAPTRSIVDTTLTVIPERTTDFVLRLPYSAEYLEHRRVLDAFIQKRRWARTWPVMLNVAGITWGVISYDKYRKAHRQLETDLANYEDNVVPAEIAVLTNETIPEHKQDFRQARDMAVISASFTALSAGYTWWRFKRTGQWEKPVFDDRERIRFEGLAYLPGAQGGHWATAITIPLAR